MGRHLDEELIMKRLGIETCAQLGWISRGRWCGTGMITTKVIQSALIQTSLPPTALGIRSHPFRLAMEVF